MERGSSIAKIERTEVASFLVREGSSHNFDSWTAELNSHLAQ